MARPKRMPKDSILASAADGSPVVEIFALEYKDGKLVMDCKALGSMRMDVIIEPEDVAKGWPVIKRDWRNLVKFVRRLPRAFKDRRKALKEQQAKKEAKNAD